MVAKFVAGANGQSLQNGEVTQERKTYVGPRVNQQPVPQHRKLSYIGADEILIHANTDKDKSNIGKFIYFAHAMLKLQVQGPETISNKDWMARGTKDGGFLVKCKRRNGFDEADLFRKLKRAQIKFTERFPAARHAMVAQAKANSKPQTDPVVEQIENNVEQK